jgi:hypothetical protein
VPESAYSRAVLGVYEMTRVELLRDMSVWPYERSTQEYLAIKKDDEQADPQRLIWREFIKETLPEVIQYPNEDSVGQNSAPCYQRCSCRRSIQYPSPGLGGVESTSSWVLGALWSEALRIFVVEIVVGTCVERP